MDRKAVAREIRDAIFDRAEQDGRVMHGDAMDQIIEQVLAKHEAAYVWAPEKPFLKTWTACEVDIRPGAINWVDITT